MARLNTDLSKSALGSQPAGRRPPQGDWRGVRCELGHFACCSDRVAGEFTPVDIFVIGKRDPHRLHEPPRPAGRRGRKLPLPGLDDLSKTCSTRSTMGIDQDRQPHARKEQPHPAFTAQSHQHGSGDAGLAHHHLQGPDPRSPMPYRSATGPKESQLLNGLVPCR
jgi:hypothetical protein